MTFKVNTSNLVKPAEFDASPLENGLHKVTIKTVEYGTSSQGNKMLKIVFVNAKNRFIYDQILDDPTKPVNTYRLGRLLHAINIELNQAVELRDMVKVIKPGKELVVALFTKPGSTFTNVDINNYNGYYRVEEVETDAKIGVAQAQASNVEETLVADTPELDINSDDSTF